MSLSDKIVDVVLRLFNLLTFLLAVLAFFGFCQMLYLDQAGAKNAGDFIFVALLFVINGGIVWKTGSWLIAKPSQIYVPGLLVFWLFLFFILMMVALSGWAGAGPGAGG
jgi:hypothetical protein